MKINKKSILMVLLLAFTGQQAHAWSWSWFTRGIQRLYAPIARNYGKALIGLGLVGTAPFLYRTYKHMRLAQELKKPGIDLLCSSKKDINDHLYTKSSNTSRLESIALTFLWEQSKESITIDNNKYNPYLLLCGIPDELTQKAQTMLQNKNKQIAEKVTKEIKTPWSKDILKTIKKGTEKLQTQDAKLLWANKMAEKLTNNLEEKIIFARTLNFIIEQKQN